MIYLLVTLGALAAFVWALRPDRPKVQPAPLHPQDTFCPQQEGQFTPTNLTELPGLELASLSKEHRNHVLLRLNMEPCPCGCNSSIAYCLVTHERCAKCRELAQEIIAEEGCMSQASHSLSHGYPGCTSAGAGRSSDSRPDAHAASGEEASKGLRP